MNVNLYGKIIQATEGETDGIIAFMLGRAWGCESAPNGFAFVPDDSQEWRRGYELAVFGADGKEPD